MPELEYHYLASDLYFLASKKYNIYNFIPFFTSYNQFMYNVKNMAQPPDEPAGVAENGGQFAISRETDKAASC